MLLLVLFVKPLLVQPEGPLEGGARKVVIRNLVCTGLLCISYMITTVVMVSALLQETPEDNTVRMRTVAVSVDDSKCSRIYGWGAVFGCLLIRSSDLAVQ